MENKELNIIMEEMRVRVRGEDNPDNYAKLFALEMGLKPESKKLAVPIHPDDVLRAFTYYLKKKGVRTDFNSARFFLVIKGLAPTKPMRINKYDRKAKGRAMTPIKLVNPLSAIFELLKEIDSVEE
jgi:hypothetical protein